MLLAAGVPCGSGRILEGRKCGLLCWQGYGGLSWVPGTSCFSGSQEVKPHMQMCPFQTCQGKAVGGKSQHLSDTHPISTVDHSAEGGSLGIRALKG